MKIATILLFAFTVSCVGFNSEKTKKIYICGDHECKNNAEVKDYFKNNISIEVYTVTSSTKKNKDFNLVQLNMSDKEKNKVVSIKSKEDVIKKELENRKKLAKINVKLIRGLDALGSLCFYDNCLLGVIRQRYSYWNQRDGRSGQRSL